MLSIRDLPNVLTVARMLLVGPLVYLLLVERFTAALVLAVVAGLSDWLDGALARRFSWQSHFGGLLDPLADKLLMVATYATLAWLDKLPMWLFILVVLRDVVIVTGGLIYHLRFEAVKAQPTRMSKANTLFQVLLMWFVLTALAGLPVPRLLIDGMIALVAATAVVTLFQYVFLWGARARRIAQARNSDS
ncbi:MAG: CDP-alcohol phosphatidyltransferase family protein [Wenzhouxiangellaceae bacterium]